MKMTGFTPVDHGVVVTTDKAYRLRIEAWRENILRLSCTNTEFCEDIGEIVTATPDAVPYTVTEDDKSFRFAIAGAALTIRKETFALRFYDGEKELCRFSRWGLQLRDTTVTVPHHVPDRDTTDKLKLDTTETRPGYKFYASFDLQTDEVIHGLGQFGHGAMNRREAPCYLFQTNNYAPVPCWVSSKGYGVLVNTGSYGSFMRDTFGTTFYADSVDMGDLFLIAGGGDVAVRGYRALTGQVPMMPKWLFGYAQSRERYSTQEELVGIVKEYRRRQVPLDLVVQDWSYWPTHTWSDKSFDSSRYPDPTKMCEDIHDMNAHVMISVWPNTRGGDNFKELFEKGQLLTHEGTYGGGGAYNVFDPAARDTYWNQLNNIFKHGIDAWWCDATEPFEPHYGDYVEVDEQKAVSLSTYKRWMDSRKINLFSLLQSGGVYEHQRGVTEDKRVVNLTRSGYAGQQRYATVVWSGDIGGTFEEMKTQIAEGVNYSAAGLPYWTLDIGGFWSHRGESRHNSACPYGDHNDAGYRELYTRWLQFGAFLPVFRSHGTCFPREIWRFGEEGEMFYEAIRKFIELRYTLLPYIYSTAWDVSANGASFIRPLTFDFPTDRTATEQNTSYLFGRAFLVSPVVEAQYYEGNNAPMDAPHVKNVYLPAGANWYDFWNENVYTGGQTVAVDTPIDSMPLFVRAGSIIPTGPVMQYANERPDAPYTVTVYPGADGTFTLYEDEGDNYNYEQGAYATYDVKWDDAARVLHISDRRGEFAGMCKERELTLRVVGGGTKTLTYTGTAVDVQF